MNKDPSVHEITPRMVARFEEKFTKSDGCWVWNRCKNKNGYGWFSTGKYTKVKAHRLAWIMARGTIPGGLHVCHTCDNPPCVNPDHLFLGTQLQNIHDCRDKGRVPKGQGRSMSKLSDENVIKIRQLYTAGGITQRELSSMFGVAQVSISRIVTQKYWKHL
jgi:hypothetical protein